MMKRKVFLTRTLHDFALRELRKRYRVEVHTGKIPIPRSKLRSSIRDADGLICFPYDTIDREMLESAENLVAISTYSVGFDHIDIGCAREMGIRVGYTPEVLTDATADLAFGLLLDVTRRISEGDRTIRRGNWKRIYGAYDYVGVDLQKKTLGILGLGRIGGALAKRARAFDMRIIYHNTKRVAGDMERRLGARYVSFAELLRKSDVISVHVPHTDKTDRIFDAAAFEKMKRTAFLINTSRGRVIHQGDLVTALRKGTIAGAGLDVFEEEPIKSTHPLARLENVVLAPHIGSSASGTREEMARLAVRNLNLGMAGKRPVFSVGR